MHLTHMHYFWCNVKRQGGDDFSYFGASNEYPMLADIPLRELCWISHSEKERRI